MTNDVRIKRVYDEPSPEDGARVLVDRLWPRGVSKERASLALWDKAVAPSTELRKWYAHDAAKFSEFRKRYEAELEQEEQARAFEQLKDLVAKGPVTLLTASKALGISEAAVLQDLLTQ